MRLRNIEALRFVAALLVMLFHFVQGYEAATGQRRWVTLHYIGFSGVDVFFCISGAIMWHTTRTVAGPGESARFLARRLARIVPSYWGFLALFAAALAVAAPQILANADLVAAVALLPLPAHMLPPAWTLSYEILFYGLFSALILLPPHCRLPILACGAALIAGLTALRLERSVIPNISLVFALEFISGCFAASAAMRANGRWAWGAAVAGCVLLAAILEVSARRGELLASPEWMRVALFGSMAALFVYAAIGLEAGGRLRAPPMLVRAGSWSYALYLFHASVMLMFAPLGGMRILALPTTLKDLCLLGIVLATVAAAAVLAEAADLPLYRALTRGLRSTPRPEPPPYEADPMAASRRLG